MPNPQRAACLFLSGVPGRSPFDAKGAFVETQWEARRQTAKGREAQWQLRL